jgi:uncharacterized membrane protein HdeD (DUF308 family)
MDFVIKLLLSRESWTGYKYNFILIIINRLIKYIYIILYNKSNTTKKLLYILLWIIIVNHGVPKEIILNQDKLFISKFWTILMALMGIKKKLLLVFHP